MNGISCMHEYGRSSCAVECSDHFLSDDGAFPDPAYNQPPARFADKFYDFGKGIVKKKFQTTNGFTLNSEGSFSQLKDFAGCFSHKNYF